ncbi:hypothetical protein ACIRG5_47450 [Lentzea sp. NPDC102401]|uniref:hypothetical protein n=1 Tax=Lentzea sp. NPDC102401 TaxID=3364128 RepID=UPI003830B77F
MSIETNPWMAPGGSWRTRRFLTPFGQVSKHAALTVRSADGEVHSLLMRLLDQGCGLVAAHVTTVVGAST